MAEKMVIREYYELCDGGICQDLLTEAEKNYVANGGMILSGVIQRCGVPNGNGRNRPLSETCGRKQSPWRIRPPRIQYSKFVERLAQND